MVISQYNRITELGSSTPVLRMKENLSIEKSTPTCGQSSNEKIRTDRRIWQTVEITNRETGRKCEHCKEPIGEDFTYWIEKFWCNNCVGVYIHPPTEEWYYMLQSRGCFLNDCSE